MTAAADNQRRDDMLGLERAIGRIEGKLDTYMKGQDAFIKQCEARTGATRTDAGNLWAAVGRHGERIQTCETKIEGITKDALKSGVKGGGIVAGSGLTAFTMIFLFLKYLLPIL